VDNLCKFLLDCLNGVLYNDDGQVIRLVAEKSFGNDRGGNGYTIVSISACSE
jgi:Holliday junction resolvase RusA-like endonuclease